MQEEAVWTVVPAGDGTAQAPQVRYGHSLTRCGARGEYLVAFGGLTSGGYRGPLDDTVVLRPRPPMEEQLAEADKDGETQELCGASLQFYCPNFKGPTPMARGYHSATASEDGTKLFIFGGISRGSPTNQLAVLDVASWTWDIPATTGNAPCPRFGSAMVVGADAPPASMSVVVWRLLCSSANQHGLETPVMAELLIVQALVVVALGLSITAR